MIFVFVAFLIVLRVLSLMLVLTDNTNMKKEGENINKIKKTAIIVTSSILETGWAIGTGIIVGQLST